jgi:hypothetical protein
LPETIYYSLVNLGAAAPQIAQNLSLPFRGAPHLTQKGKQSTKPPEANKEIKALPKQAKLKINPNTQ